MRLCLAALALLGAFAPAPSAQTAGDPFALPRIGAEVDADERAYFLLFPSLGEADTLWLAWTGPDSVRVATAPGEALVVSAEKAQALGDVAARYEDLFDEPEPTVDPAAVAGLIRWRLPFRSRPISAVTLRGGTEVRGELLDADTEGVVVATGPLPFRDARSLAGLVWVPASDVLRVRQFGFQSTLDVRPGGDRSRYEAEALPALRRELTFIRGLSPEIRAWQRARPPAPKPAGLNPGDPYAGAPLNRWQVGIRLRAGALGAGTATTDPYGTPPPVADDLGGWAVGGTGRLGYNVTAALGVEAAIRALISERMEGAVLDGRRYVVVAADLTASYALVRPQLRRLSLAVRAGASVVGSRASTELGYFGEGAPFTGDGRFAGWSAPRVGAVAGVEGAFRLWRGASLAAGCEWAVYPSIEEGEVLLIDRQYRIPLKRVDARTADLQFRGVEAGLILHLGEW